MIGKKLGHFEIVEKIGAGGMGEIYRARDEHLDRDVALKVLPTRTSLDQTVRRRFRREALTLAKLKHAHIGAVYDFGDDNGIEYLVMELIPGTDLAATLKAGALPENETVRLGVQIAEALEEAHEQKVVHLDLKPQNVMVTPKGQAKVLDFGLARLVRPLDEASTASLSEVQTVAGTLPYMAPEQLREGAEVDARTDVYALGVTLYEMAAGNRPFQQTDAGTLITAILNMTPPGLRETATDVSGDLDRIVQKALQKDPAQRYQTVKELREDLERCQAGLPVAAPHVGRRRFGRRAVLAAAAVVAILAGAFALNPMGIRERIVPGLGGVAAPTHDFVVAVTPFWGPTDEAQEEGKVMQALIERRIRELVGQEKDIEILGSVEPPRTHEEAQEFGKSVGASMVIWGEVITLRDEVEIQPYITMHESMNRRYDPNLGPLQATLADPNQLSLRKGKAEEMGGAALIVVAEYYRGSDPEKALSLLRNTRSPSADNLLWQGKILRDLKRWDEAEAAFERAIVMEPRNPDTHMGLGITYYVQGQYDLAEGAFREAVNVNPTDSRARDRLGWTYARLSRFDEAATEFEKGHQLDPNEENTISGLFRSYLHMGSLDKAASWLEGLIETHSNTYEVGSRLGVAHSILGHTEEAAEAYDRALQMNPKQVHLQLIRFLWVFRAGRSLEAQSVIDSYVEDLPDEAHFLSFVARYFAGEISEEAAFEAMKVDDPTEERHRLCEAYYYVGLGHLIGVMEARTSSPADTVRAIDYFERCVATSVVNYWEYHLATAELKRLEQM